MPLRLPRASERIDPPLIDVFVEDGFIYKTDNTNTPEARFIVDEILAICADQAMIHRTIGVVSLLGDKQALKVWKMLEQELGPEKIAKFKIACGDARTFQGKERNIMFLSMVIAPNETITPILRGTSAQCFNVAASRAQDRMYLVRSVELDALRETDELRRGLVSHFTHPFLQEEKQVDDLRELCESSFEREMYDELRLRLETSGLTW
jgi:superfamily I DNA and/or RNA helicase